MCPPFARYYTNWEHISNLKGNLDKKERPFLIWFDHFSFGDPASQLGISAVSLKATEFTKNIAAFGELNIVVWVS
jgi:hypothetical protein